METKMARYIITDKGFIVDTQMFGFDTAGSSNQHHIKIVGKKVYECYWSAGNEWVDDINEEIYIGNIVYETDTKLKILDEKNYGEEIG